MRWYIRKNEILLKLLIISFLSNNLQFGLDYSHNTVPSPVCQMLSCQVRSGINMMYI
jgi:hypothetical protein